MQTIDDADTAENLVWAHDQIRELSDRMNADRCLWLWWLVHEELTPLTFRLALALETDSPIKSFEERKQLRIEVVEICKANQRRIAKDYGYYDWLRAVLEFVHSVDASKYGESLTPTNFTNGLGRFVEAGINEDWRESFIRFANVLPNQMEVIDPFDCHQQLNDPFAILRLAVPDNFNNVLIAILTDVWRYLRIAWVLDRLKDEVGSNDHLFMDQAYRERVRNLVNELTENSAPKPQHGTPYVADANLCTGKELEDLYDMNAGTHRRWAKAKVIAVIDYSGPNGCARYDRKASIKRIKELRGRDPKAIVRDDGVT